MTNLLGSAPNQVPTNGDLGTMAFQDSHAVNITGGTSYNLISSMALIHSNVAKANDTIPENVNALTLLPISIPTGTSVTVGSGSTWNFLDLS